VLVIVVQLLVLLKASGVLTNECRLAEQLLVPGKALFIAELVGIGEELVFGKAEEGILDPGALVANQCVAERQQNSLGRSVDLHVLQMLRVAGTAVDNLFVRVLMHDLLVQVLGLFRARYPLLVREGRHEGCFVF
jgi:hypothetical protein